MNGFNVTYETVTQESAREHGYLGQDMTFRDAIQLFNGERDWTYVEADSWPISAQHPPRWFTDYGEIQFASGDCRSVSFHLPNGISGHSAMRIARLLRCYGSY